MQPRGRLCRLRADPPGTHSQPRATPRNGPPQALPEPPNPFRGLEGVGARAVGNAAARTARRSREQHNSQQDEPTPLHTTLGASAPLPLAAGWLPRSGRAVVPVPPATPPPPPPPPAPPPPVSATTPTRRPPPLHRRRLRRRHRRLHRHCRRHRHCHHQPYHPPTPATATTRLAWGTAWRLLDHQRRSLPRPAVALSQAPWLDGQGGAVTPRASLYDHLATAARHPRPTGTTRSASAPARRKVSLSSRANCPNCGTAPFARPPTLTPSWQRTASSMRLTPLRRGCDVVCASSSTNLHEETSAS